MPSSSPRLEEYSNNRKEAKLSESSALSAGDALRQLTSLKLTSDLGERLKALRDAVSGRIVFPTSFGVEDQLLTHVVATQSIDIELVTLDTGRLFPATYRLWEQTEGQYGRRIRSVYPDSAALEALVADAGINGFYFSREARLACCHVRKVEPLARALDGARAWVTGVRSDQSEARGNVELASWDEERQLIKFAPLFDWTRERIGRSCEELRVPINPLHAEGYLSIGCEPCTRAVKPGEPERSGRWWWEKDGPRECGLHVVGAQISARGGGR